MHASQIEDRGPGVHRVGHPTSDFSRAMTLMVGLAQRGLSFEGMTAAEAVFNEIDRLSARVVELERRSRFDVVR